MYYSLSLDTLHAINVAHDERMERGHLYLDAEHVLFGLASDKGALGEVLPLYGITPELVHEQIDDLLGTGKRTDVLGSPTKHIREVLDLARRDIKGDAEPVHVLRAICLHGDSIAFQILTKLTADHGGVVHLVRHLQILHNDWLNRSVGERPNADPVEGALQ